MMENITRRAALGGIAATSATGGAGAALAASTATMPPEQVDERIEALAGQIAELLPQHPIQRLGSGGWALAIYPRDEFWYGYHQMPGNKWREPLVEAIDAYRVGMRQFDLHKLDDNDEIDAYADATYAPPLKTLDEWNQPALTRAGAIAALRFAVAEIDNSWLSDGVGAMIKAALGYLESGASS